MLSDAKSDDWLMSPVRHVLFSFTLTLDECRTLSPNQSEKRETHFQRFFFFGFYSFLKLNSSFQENCRLEASLWLVKW